MRTASYTAPPLLFLFSSCASVPPEYLSSMEKQREGIELLEANHKKAVTELVDNWHKERLKVIGMIRDRELEKNAISVPVKDGEDSAQFVPLQAVKRIEKQYAEAVQRAGDIRNALIKNYSDSQNWGLINRLHNVNLEMAKSLTDLNKAQRAFYKELIEKINLSPVKN